MYKIKETIIVEGTYDKIKLSRFIDGTIFVTDGFSVFNNKKKIESIKTLAKKTGIVIFTDSDTAGFKIRNYIKQHIDKNLVKHAYIPEIAGKEKRKTVAGKEGLLGVEGIDEKILIKALYDAGCEIEGVSAKTNQGRNIKKADLYMLGLSGGLGSNELRNQLAKVLGIPSKISSNMLLDVVNRLLTYEELCEIVSNIKNII